jgi:hypothetical protein
MTFRLFWPTRFGTITQGFGERPAFYAQFNLPGHEGLDIRAPHGSDVLAAADGTVRAVHLNGNIDPKKHPYGNEVRIAHAGGYETIYAHLKSVAVAVGKTVSAGDVIGEADSTGNSQGSHLHLTLKKQGATARGETRYPNDIIDPTPFLQPFSSVAPTARHLPAGPMRGLHGDGAADWMLSQGVTGWAVETIYSMGDLINARPVDFSAHAAAGIRVLVRWNYSWARDSAGGLGTYPPRDQYNEFADWCLNSIRSSKGVWGHIIGNEPNRAAERPDFQDAANPGTPIPPSDVVYLYNYVWKNLSVETRVSPPAIDPTNAETMDPREYWRQIIREIQGAEFFALHAYGYGSKQALNSSQRFDPPMRWQYRSFRMWESLAEVIYGYKRYQRLPLIITEANHLTLDGQPDQNGWDADASPWVRAAYDYLLKWNREPGEQYVHGLCLYRFTGDAWRLDNQQEILDTLKVCGPSAL